eukprot:5905764-Pyramimonas_sp.AAC.1
MLALRPVSFPRPWGGDLATLPAFAGAGRLGQPRGLVRPPPCGAAPWSILFHGHRETLMMPSCLSFSGLGRS